MTIQNQIILFSLLFLTSNYALAQSDYSELRLDKAGGSMEHVSVLDQGDLGICFSYSASQLVDAYRFSHGADTTQRTSPIEAGIGMGASTIESILLGTPSSQIPKHSINDNGGNVCEVIDYFNKKGICPEQRMLLDQIDPQQREDVISTLSDAFYQAGSNPNIKKLLNEVNCTRKSVPGFPELQDIELLATALNKKNVMDFVNDVLTVQCNSTNRLPSFNPKCVRAPLPGFSNLAKEKYQEIIEERLAMNEPKQPISIGYCSGVLRNGPGFKGIVKMADYDFKIRSEKCGYHESLIIGKRQISYINHLGITIKYDQYLIRNSWGNDTSSYSPAWETDKGNVWVNADDLLENIDSVTYLESR